MEGATYFITFRTKEGSLTLREQVLALEHFKYGGDVFYTLIAVTVMPDHVHVLLKPHKNYDLSRIMKGLKGVAAHKINALRGSGGRVWQDESYDRIVRNNTELRRFFRYMLNNPLKKGLCEDPWTYQGWYCNEAMNPLE
jgi:putative transposase